MMDRDHTTAEDTATETHREPHGAAAPHGAAHGHDDMDGSQPLGPVDIEAWAAGALGIALGLIVAVCFVFATRGVGA